MEREIFITPQKQTVLHELPTHKIALPTPETEAERERRMAETRHKLAEQAEQIAHAATIGVTVTKIASGNHELELAELVVAGSALLITATHRLHHKYLLEQEKAAA